MFDALHVTIVSFPNCFHLLFLFSFVTFNLFFFFPWCMFYCWLDHETTITIHMCSLWQQIVIRTHIDNTHLLLPLPPLLTSCMWLSAILRWPLSDRGPPVLSWRNKNITTGYTWYWQHRTIWITQNEEKHVDINSSKVKYFVCV